jgi:hypothetical protein
MSKDIENEVEDVELTLTDLPASTSENSKPAESLFDNLREKRAQLGANQTIILSIPGYDNDPPVLMAKYRLMTGKELEDIASKVSRETKDRSERQILAAVDTFINCCEGMYFDMMDGKGPQPMKIHDQAIVGYNSDLAEALQFQAETARQVVFQIFADNDIAIMQHNVRLGLWMSNTSRKMDDDFLGLS